MHPDPGRAVLGGLVVTAGMTAMMCAPLAAEEQPAVVHLLKDPAPVGAFTVQTLGRTIRSADLRAVTIERVDPPRAVGLPSTAHVKEIPGIDLATFSGEQRAEVPGRLNTEPCTCGCQLTAAKCRIDDPDVRRQPAARPRHCRGGCGLLPKGSLNNDSVTAGSTRGLG
jgi:hypothetical protein